MSVRRTPAAAILASDTHADCESRQIEIWRSMSSVDKAAVMVGACRAARDLAMTGLRIRFPEASDRELLVRYAALTLGRDVASRVYPELANLGP